MPTRDEWHAMLEQRLPPRTTYVARNRAITALYARWYLQEPWLFQWAGMASFASDQVGVALVLVEMLNSPHGALAEQISSAQAKGLLELGFELYGRVLGMALSIPMALHDAATHQLLLDDLELIKQGNDAIFNDIGWAHLAYSTGGLKAVAANVRESEQGDLLDGFRMLDEGAHQLSGASGEADYRAGAELIRKGSVAMLRHEQMNVLPTYFDQMSDLGKIFASVGAWLDFEGATGLNGQPWFGGHYGALAIVSGSRSVTNPVDRWEWIERDVLPKWARVSAAYGERCAMHRRLVALANQAPTMLQQAAGLMNIVYPALGLRSNQQARVALPSLVQPA